MIVSIKWSPCQPFLLPLTYVWLKMSHSKVDDVRCKCLKGFCQIVPWMVVLSILGQTTLLKFDMPKKPKDFSSTNCYKQLKFQKVKV
jgi:hypothetical protein